MISFIGTRKKICFVNWLQIQLVILPIFMIFVMVTQLKISIFMCVLMQHTTDQIYSLLIYD